MYNNDFFQNTNETNISGDNNYVNNDMDVNVNMNNNGPMNQNIMGGCSGRVQERVINRTFVHEVPQDCSFMIEK